MKKLFVILGFISAIVATILSVTKFSNLAVTPIIIAFVSGLIVIFLSKKGQPKTKTIQYIFLLVISSLSLTIYKGVINPPNLDATETDAIKIDSTDQIQLQKKEILKKPKEIFDLKENDQKI